VWVTAGPALSVLAFWPEPDGLLDGWVPAALAGLPAAAPDGLAQASPLDGWVPAALAVRLGDCSSSGEVQPSGAPRAVASWFAVLPED
jgi:hypothetical protein